jgi:hypothetical protein
MASYAITVELGPDDQPPGVINRKGVICGLTEYHANKGVTTYHERRR